MIKHLLPPVTYYKANLHTHSTVSDGKMTPEELRDAYKAKGYSILAITDHSVMVEHQALNQPDFLLLTGMEIDMDIPADPLGIGGRAERHFCLIGKDPKKLWIPFSDPRPIPASVPYEALDENAGLSRLGSAENTNLVIAECNRQGFLVTYNHPVWSGDSYPEYSTMRGLWGMEYRNGGCIALGFDENNSRVYDDLLSAGNGLMPVCADDTHAVCDKRTGYPVLGTNWSMIGAEKLDYDSVISAMERGDVYASCGPTIHSLILDGDELRITCSPAVKVQLVSNARTCQMAHGNGGTLTEASFQITKWQEKYRDNPKVYLRFIVTAPDGTYAVTRAYWFRELQP